MNAIYWYIFKRTNKWPVNSNLSRGGVWEIKSIGGDLRGGHTLTQIGCDKTPLPSHVHAATYRTASSSPVPGRNLSE